MRYRELAEVYSRIEGTSSRAQVTAELADLFSRSPHGLIGRIAYLTQGKLRPDWEGVELGLGEKTAVPAVALATGASERAVARRLQQLGDLGTAAQESLRDREPLPPPLEVGEVYAALERIALSSGEGTQARKAGLLADLLKRASPLEARYLLRTVTGRLRVGVGDASVLDGLVRAFGARKELVERAYNLTADLGAVASALAREGPGALERFRPTAGKPIRPMLAERLYSIEEVIEKLGGRCLAEYKYDGERLQIHKSGDAVELISRRLEKVTEQYPDVVEAARECLRGRQLVVEGEVVAVDPRTGRLLPFQSLMPRRRKHGVAEAVARIPTAVFLFDVLFADGEDLTSRPLGARRERLERLLVPSDRMRLATSKSIRTSRALDAFFHQALRDGCEGLVCKDAGGTYRAGARGWSWIKLKREYRAEMKEPVDLVVVGAFHGRGRRAGTYGALLLAAYEPEEDVFRTACKCGTGFSDQELAALPARLRPYERKERDPRVDSAMEADVWFDPQVVLEIVGAELTLSPIHTAGRAQLGVGSGLAVRFPRFTGRWRADKGPQEATSASELVEMYRRRTAPGVAAGVRRRGRGGAAGWPLESGGPPTHG